MSAKRFWRIIFECEQYEGIAGRSSIRLLNKQDTVGAVQHITRLLACGEKLQLFSNTQYYNEIKGMRIHVYRRNVQICFCLQILTTCLGVQSYGNPRMRMITSKLLDKNACASYDAPPATLRKSSPVARYTSIYRLPI